MLTNVEIRALKPATRPFKVSDTKGLYLLVQPSGSLLWRFRYRAFGVERKLSLGSYPEVSLKDARLARDEARAQLIDGEDPVEEKRQLRIKAELAAQTTFELVANEYIEKMEREGRSPATIKKARWFLELLAGVAKRPIASVTPHELLDVLKKVERRGHHETASRLRSFAGRVFRYGFATLRTERNPADILRGALTVPRVKHHAALIEPKKIGELLRAIEDYSGRPETQFALRLAPHVFLRPGELRAGRWSEIDFAEKVWRIPAERMKMKQVHTVPLSRQAMYLLQELRALARPSEFLFPALHTTKRCISENTLNVALRRLGYRPRSLHRHAWYIAPISTQGIPLRLNRTQASQIRVDPPRCNTRAPERLALDRWRCELSRSQLAEQLRCRVALPAGLTYTVMPLVILRETVFKVHISDNKSCILYTYTYFWLYFMRDR